jgi:hypothetical protein
MAEPDVALYRQWKLSEDEVGTCTQVCSEEDPNKYGCPRATFMGMASIHQSSYLTMTEPPGLPNPGALLHDEHATSRLRHRQDRFMNRRPSSE